MLEVERWKQLAHAVPLKQQSAGALLRADIGKEGLFEHRDKLQEWHP